MIRVEFHPEVSRDLVDATHWYNVQLPGLGDEFSDEIDKAIEAISLRPETWPFLSGDTRRYLVRRFPYEILYTYEKGAVYVRSVIHLSRRPGSWRRRRKPRSW